MSISQEASQPHIALFPSAGIGHLMPFLRLTTMLLSHDCKIPFPTIIRFEATSRSSHLIHPLLASLTPPLSAIFADLVVANGVGKAAVDLGVRNYIVSTTSLKFLSLMAYLPILTTSDAAKLANGAHKIEITGMTPFPISSIPPPFFSADHGFTATLLSNVKALPYCNGIIMNTFESFEPESLSAIKNKRALSNLPTILPIGLLETYELNINQARYLPWLNDQPAESVVLLSFGSRTAMSKDQIRELRDGLERSGHQFLWVLKTKKVDKDENEEDLEEILGSLFLERTKDRCMVLKEWVNQQDVLGHSAIGGFVSHCGWNSVMEAARNGVPVLAWPQHGD
ncbi:putative UDP-glucosyl transferase 88A1 [Hibiscus syriacus]|uniref:UDP-glucosyl transferase 88A1 n=1 Tax=Hibiscus syriacus TaxID=106335 RepID=A0A6A2XRK0_HIBSY|nr:putative UDP-glucosyl transferase 88A1 [Hibiscus syriacus]